MFEDHMKILTKSNFKIAVEYLFARAQKPLPETPTPSTTHGPKRPQITD